MKIVVLDAATLGADLDLSPLEVLGQLTVYANTAPEEIPARIAGQEVIVSNKMKLNEENLKGAHDLKLICLAATGYDCVDTAYCRSRGIGVCNVPGYSTHSVSQLALAMALALSTHLTAYRDCVHSGTYTRSGIANRLEPVWYELCGKTWGIVGGGNIGQEVAKIAAAMGCKVLMCRRKPDPAYETVDIDTLCARSDVISVHVALNDETRGMISKERIGKMKPGAIFINVARGAVADEAALAEAVLEGKLGGLGIDVYTAEPFPEDHPYSRILHLPNVCLTPHMAWGAKEARDRCLAIVAENIRAFRQGESRNRVE